MKLAGEAGAEYPAFVTGARRHAPEDERPPAEHLDAGGGTCRAPSSMSSGRWIEVAREVPAPARMPSATVLP